jgi:hypothetical protein
MVRFFGPPQTTPKSDAEKDEPECLAEPLVFSLASTGADPDTINRWAMK